jgi:hypothetical protein
MDDQRCPSCGISKPAWTVRMDRTRLFALGKEWDGDPDSQVPVLLAASELGTPFCEKCEAAKNAAEVVIQSLELDVLAPPVVTVELLQLEVYMPPAVVVERLELEVLTPAKVVVQQLELDMIPAPVVAIDDLELDVVLPPVVVVERLELDMPAKPDDDSDDDTATDTDTDTDTEDGGPAA